MHRLFVAIRPPEDIREILIDAMDEDLAFRWQSDEQLHLTLRFVGEVERLAPFTVDRVTLFESHLSRHGAHYEGVTSHVLR